MTTNQGRDENRRDRRLGTILVLAVLLTAGGAFAGGGDSDSDSDRHRGDDRRRPRRGVCSATAGLQLTACRAETRDDYFGAQAICLNVANRRERRECFHEARSGAREARTLCDAQRRARLELCRSLGEGRYDPDFDPGLFDDDFENPGNPNPYFPLHPGKVWNYETDGETNRVSVLPRTKLIEGVTCIVVQDLVVAEDGASEDTFDWFAQRKNGDVDYCGEEVKDFETFPGDEPMDPELVAIDGSFKVGRDGDRPGTIMPGERFVGQAYRQEWSAGNAEDAATILSTTYRYGEDEELDELVPQELAELMCAARPCVVTGDVSPIEPDVFERKYYAHGIGVFLEVKPEDEEINQLVGCNFDPRCDAL